jgi:hypothetical protein
VVGSEVLDQERLSALLSVALLPVAATSRQVTVAFEEELASATAGRRVLKYLARGLDAQGPVPVIAKVFTELRRAQLLYQHLQTLSAGPFVDGRLRVPQPLALLPDHNLVLYRPGVGVPLSLVDESTPALEGVRDAARWLVRLHTSGVRLPRRFDGAQEVRSTRQWADLVAGHKDRLLRPAHQLASRWAPADWPTSSRADVPLHKDYHPGHVLIDDCICVIDLDEARHGDATFDLAHFCAYLEWQSDRADDMREAFLAEYVASTGWTNDGAFASYSAYTWLKIAKQLATRSGPCRAEGQDHGWEAGDAVARGIACLAQ